MLLAAGGGKDGRGWIGVGMCPGRAVNLRMLTSTADRWKSLLVFQSPTAPKLKDGKSDWKCIIHMYKAVLRRGWDRGLHTPYSWF